jgi:hypothetical protein
MLFSLETGDEVAVVPEFGDSLAKTLEIAPIIRVWRGQFILPGNRISGRVDGCPIGNATTGVVVPATGAHRGATRRNADAGLVREKSRH